MDTDRYLILIDGEDKTSSVIKWTFDKRNLLVFVTFTNRKSYSYRRNSFRVIENPNIIPCGNNIVLKSGSALQNVEKLLSFGSHYRIVYKNGHRETCQASKLQIITSILEDHKAKNCFDYLKQIAEKTGLIVDGHNILASRYNKIDFIRSDSVFASYLSGSNPPRATPQSLRAVYPFSFNLSQKKAVQNALAQDISIIEGPPGTGKTQTILNIIANVIIRGGSVAVVSNNNSATANVFEKLQKYGLDFIVAPLGSSENKEAFVENQKPEIPVIDEKETDQYYDCYFYEDEICKMLTAQNELSDLSGQLSQVKTEYEHFLDYYNKQSVDPQTITFKYGITAEKILEFAAEYELLEQKNKLIGFIKLLILKWRYRIKKMNLDGVSFVNLSAFCQNEFYKYRISEIEEAVAEKENYLKESAFDTYMKNYTSAAMAVLKRSLATKYRGVTTRKVYELDDLWKNSEMFIRDYPVVLSTTYSLRSSLSNKTVYDYVIIDEASQVDIATGALALSCARQTVIVGDLKQLPNVVNQNEREITNAVFKSFDISEAYRYADNSILSSVTKLFRNAPRVLLREHYRCHPEIIGFCNQRFYNGELTVLTKPQKDCEHMMVYRTVQGNHARDHFNQRQIDVIKNEVIPQQRLNLMDGSVGIVTPYRNQANALQREFSGTAVKADTADKFQGQERSVMIFSTVDNEIGDFTSDPNRLNVAVSRAIDQFIVVTDGNENDFNSPIHDLIGYIQYNRHEIINSNLHSVFDYLYERNAEAREKVLKKYGRYSSFDSENLTLVLIRSILSSDEFSSLGVSMNVPLRMVLNNLDKLESRELSFASNELAHLDFLIFSKLTHQPVLAIEVDGFAYHNSDKQMERDRVKNAILIKYGIPILRLSTTGSEERAKIIEALNNIGKS